MKKFTFMAAYLLWAAAPTLTSCSDNDDPNGGGSDNDQTATLLDYSAENADNWHNYSVQVARLLANDANRLNQAWTVSYNGGAAFADIFRNHSGNGYTSPLNCIEEMIDGCADIANEVGTAKIGDPMTSTRPDAPKRPSTPWNHGTAGTHAKTIPTTSTPSATPTTDRSTAR